MLIREESHERPGSLAYVNLCRLLTLKNECGKPPGAQGRVGETFQRVREVRGCLRATLKVEGFYLNQYFVSTL